MRQIVFVIIRSYRYGRDADGRMEGIMSAYLTYEERLEIEAGLKEHRTIWGDV